MYTLHTLPAETQAELAVVNKLVLVNKLARLSNKITKDFAVKVLRD